jgi:hypothetical protein
VQDVDQAYRVEARGVDLDRVEHVPAIDLRTVARDPLGRYLQAVGVEVHEGQAGLFAGEPAPVQEEARAHADVEVVCRDVPVVQVQHVFAGTAPDEPAEESESKPVVGGEKGLAVQGLSGLNLLGRDLSRLPAPPSPGGRYL